MNLERIVKMAKGIEIIKNELKFLTSREQIESQHDTDYEKIDFLFNWQQEGINMLIKSVEKLIQEEKNND
jgi:hypothetical protein